MSQNYYPVARQPPLKKKGCPTLNADNTSPTVPGKIGVVKSFLNWNSTGLYVIPLHLIIKEQEVLEFQGRKCSGKKYHETIYFTIVISISILNTILYYKKVFKNEWPEEMVGSR